MPTRYEFGFGYGEIFRRRMRAEERMHRQWERELQRLPPQERLRQLYEGDYYGFRGAGVRAPRPGIGGPRVGAGYRPRGRPRPEDEARGFYRRGMEPRRWGGR